MMPLAMASPGESVQLVSVHGGQRLCRRLADLGLNIGMVVRVVQRSDHGPLILDVKGSRLVIGRGMAHHIHVQPCAETCLSN